MAYGIWTERADLRNAHRSRHRRPSCCICDSDDPTAETDPEDLAPGDVRALEVEWPGCVVERVRSADHPLFPRLYERLWREFGALGEMEKQSVIAQRLEWDPHRPVNHHALLYEMLAVLAGDEIVGLRDHTAIVPMPPHRGDHPGQIFVHLSHVIVEPPLRGGGLSGGCAPSRCRGARMRAAAASRRAIASPGRRDGASGPTHADDHGSPALLRSRRLSQGRSDAVRYVQPDFRPAAEIDRQLGAAGAARAGHPPRRP
jgi:hypothetical protein